MFKQFFLGGKTNVIKKEADTILKSKDFTIEIKHVECKNKCDTSNNRETETISKSFRKYLTYITGKH
jgi:hypothetical protein